MSSPFTTGPQGLALMSYVIMLLTACGQGGSGPHSNDGNGPTANGPKMTNVPGAVTGVTSGITEAHRSFRDQAGSARRPDRFLRGRRRCLFGGAVPRRAETLQSAQRLRASVRQHRRECRLLLPTRPSWPSRQSSLRQALDPARSSRATTFA